MEGRWWESGNVEEPNAGSLSWSLGGSLSSSELRRGSTALALGGMPSLPESPLSAQEPAVPHSSLGSPDMKEMVILEAKKYESERAHECMCARVCNVTMSLGHAALQGGPGTSR